MSKQTAAPTSRAAADEQSSTGVIDAPENVDRKQLAREREEVKERQKDRFEGRNAEQLIEIYRQLLWIRRFE